MPAHLAERSANLREKFYSYDKEQRNKQAFENRENNLNNAKLECKEIGFNEGTEAFGECVLDLTE